MTSKCIKQRIKKTNSQCNTLLSINKTSSTAPARKTGFLEKRSGQYD